MKYFNQNRNVSVYGLSEPRNLAEGVVEGEVSIGTVRFIVLKKNYENERGRYARMIYFETV